MFGTAFSSWYICFVLFCRSHLRNIITMTPRCKSSLDSFLLCSHTGSLGHYPDFLGGGWQEKLQRMSEDYLQFSLCLIAAFITVLWEIQFVTLAYGMSAAHHETFYTHVKHKSGFQEFPCEKHKLCLNLVFVKWKVCIFCQMYFCHHKTFITPAADRSFSKQRLKTVSSTKVTNYRCGRV